MVRPGEGPASRRYVGALATVLAGSAVPYGYTVTVWTSGVMLIRLRGLPSPGHVFLFMAGAVGAFGLLGLVVRLTAVAPLEARSHAFVRIGMIQFIAVAAALGAATLIAHIHSPLAWPLGSFAATATYLLLVAIELSVAAAR